MKERAWYEQARRLGTPSWDELPELMRQNFVIFAVFAKAEQPAATEPTVACCDCGSFNGLAHASDCPARAAWLAAEPAAQGALDYTRVDPISGQVVNRDAPQDAPVKCEYHPIYRECVRCGGAMNRGDDLECPTPGEVVK
jgi:hypothetical protein